MADAPDELFLIDGNSLVYRAFFALPESIATSDGRPTNAIFGFASMLVKILTEHGPKATIVAWDAGMSGRDTEYEPYKAERRPRPDLLSEQWPHLEPLVQQFGSLEGVLAHVDEISGKKRQENLRENSELARVSKQLATLKRDIDTGLDVTAVTSEAPDRSRLREVFRFFELREPLRRIEEALGGDSAVSRAAPGERIDVSWREGSLTDIDSLGDGPAALAARRAGERLRWAAGSGGE